jgi:hypothetical protein
MVGDSLSWPTGVFNCDGDMAKCLANHDNAIGFIDVSDTAMTMFSNQIEEVPSQNKEGCYHTSHQNFGWYYVGYQFSVAEFSN